MTRRIVLGTLIALLLGLVGCGAGDEPAATDDRSASVRWLAAMQDDIPGMQSALAELSTATLDYDLDGIKEASRQVAVEARTMREALEGAGIPPTAAAAKVIPALEAVEATSVGVAFCTTIRECTGAMELANAAHTEFSTLIASIR